MGFNLTKVPNPVALKPADDLEIGEVGLPELVERGGLVVQLISAFILSAVPRCRFTCMILAIVWRVTSTQKACVSQGERFCMVGRSGIGGLAVLLLIGASACSPAGSQTPEDAAAKLPILKAAVDSQNKRFAAAPAAAPADADTAYAFEFGGLSTPKIPMTAFRGDVVLVVNTASRCGYTPQYTGLQTLQDTYGGRGFSVIGVPSNDFGGQEPGSAAEIKSFCEMNFGVTFPMAAKSPVTGKDAHPFYKWAEAKLGKDARPGWNFHKLLVGKDGKLIAAFPSSVEPTSPKLVGAIEGAMGS